MLAIDRIVCPINFSDASQCAFAHAVALARQCRARLTAVHVASPDTDAAASGRPAPAEDEGFVSVTHAPARLAHEIEEVVGSARRAGVAVEPVLVEGDPVSTILRHARPSAADLLVMGRRDTGGVERLVSGSIVDKVISRAECPILTVSPGVVRSRRTDVPPLARIVCAVGFSEASRRAIELAFTLVESHDSELTLLHVIELPAFSLPPSEPPGLVDLDPRLAQEAIDRLVATLPSGARNLCRLRLEVRAGNVHEEILSVANEVDAQAIVVGRRGKERGRIGRLLAGSLIDDVASEAACPVIGVRSATWAVSWH